MVRAGHRVRVYCYAPVEGLPEGVEIADAAEILPEESVVRHRSGSVALFSDRFRYALLRRGLGLWVDLDMYLLRPIEPQGPYVVGEQEPGVANGAVLLLPTDAPVLAELLALFEEGAPIPSFLPPVEKVRAGARRLLGRKAGLATLPWGTAGPHALTALLRAHDLWGEVLPRETFYPAPWRDAAWIADSGRKLESVVTPGTVGIHLWNSRIAALKDGPAAAGSFLERLQREGE